MKKTLIAACLTLAFGSAKAANFVSFDVDQVKDTRNKAESTAQYFRAGKDMAGLNLGLQVRTAVFDKGGMLNSVEGTVGKDLIKGVNTYFGVGYDNGFNGKVDGNFTYGLVGLSTGMPLGPAWGFAGAKTRINWDDSNPKQTVTFLGISMPVTKALSVSVSASRSFQDIEEKAFGVGARLAY